MKRRNLLKGLGVISLYSSFPIILGEFAVSCQNKEKHIYAAFLGDGDYATLSAVIDVLLPKTTTPGGVETQVPYFIDLVLKNCITASDQERILKGLRSLKNGGLDFSSASRQSQLQVINNIDQKAYDGDPAMAWFRIIKKLALIGHFTSQKGMTEALNYVKVPGTYEACIPYRQGDKALAKTFLLYW